MSTAFSTSTSTPPTTASHAQRPAVTNSRVWAVAGAVTGLAGVMTAVFSSIGAAAIYPDGSGQDIAGTLAKMSEQKSALLVMHTAIMVSTFAVLVFAAGLARRLKIQAPAGSLLPSVAASGLGLVAVAGLIGGGLDTEYIFGLGHPARYGPDGIMYGHWIGTMPWLWGGAGVAGAAVAVAALRYSAAPRWLGWFSAVFGGLTLLSAISPLQYLSLVTGAIWMTVAGLGFLFGDRRTNTEPAA